MPTHAEKKILPYSAEELFDLIVEIDRYPEFLPWCVGARIRKRDQDMIVADLVIGFRLFRERFTSEVRMERPIRVDVAYREGPFQYLNNHWKLTPIGERSCEIDFYVDFEFRSRILQKIVGTLFGEAVRRMVAAFESRAEQLYGERRKPN